MVNMWNSRSLLRRASAAILFVIVAVLCFADGGIAISINHGADPSILKLDGTYYSAASDGGAIYVRAASSLEGLGTASDHKIWSDTAGLGSVWAPEITMDGGSTYIYFSAGNDDNHRMYVISAATPLGPFSKEQKLQLPDDHWAIDGTMFTFEGQRWFVWSGWETTQNIEQTLYICRMSGPLTPVGPRYVISQPRESWERGDQPYINEGPEAIVDPDGQLHIVYSCNGSWDKRYCLADLRLRKGGDPTYVWDWYKSNGCLFGSEMDRLMSGWNTTQWIDGPGHHTFALPHGNVNESPGGVNHIPFVFHGVPKGTPYSWGARQWFTGSFVWLSKTTYSRQNVPGDNENTGYSFKFFEDPL
jgi:GH43 family beta-xylosidase